MQTSGFEHRKLYLCTTLFVIKKQPSLCIGRMTISTRQDNRQVTGFKKHKDSICLT